MATPHPELGALKLVHVLKFLKKHDFTPAKASELGVGLGLTDGQVATIVHNHPLSPDKVLMDVVSSWLSIDVVASWEKLADALELCGYDRIARTIRGDSTPGHGNADFSMQSLLFLRYEDNGETRTIKILEEVCNKWKDMGELIGLGNGRIQAIEKSSLKEPKECCRKVCEDWMYQGGDGDYPPSWKGLLKLLNAIELGSLRKRVQKCLEFHGL